MRTIIFALTLLVAHAASAQFWWSPGAPLNPYPSTFEGITTPYYVPYYYYGYDDLYGDDCCCGGGYRFRPRYEERFRPIPYTIGPNAARRRR